MLSSMVELAASAKINSYHIIILKGSSKYLYMREECFSLCLPYIPRSMRTVHGPIQNEHCSFLVPAVTVYSYRNSFRRLVNMKKTRNVPHAMAAALAVTLLYAAPRLRKAHRTNSPIRPRKRTHRWQAESLMLPLPTICRTQRSMALRKKKSRLSSRTPPCTRGGRKAGPSSAWQKMYEMRLSPQRTKAMRNTGSCAEAVRMGGPFSQGQDCKGSHEKGVPPRAGRFSKSFLRRSDSRSQHRLQLFHHLHAADRIEMHIHRFIANRHGNTA